MLRGKMEMVGASRTILILAINVLWIGSISHAAPVAFDPQLEIKPSWQDNSLNSIAPDPYTPNRSWEWWPLLPVNRISEETLQGESNAKIQKEGQPDEETNARTNKMKSEPSIFTPRTKSSTTMIRQASSRPVKKDIMSRSWGPGGLPFSVLYMNTHGARSNNRQNNGMSEIVPTRPTVESSARRNGEGAASTVSSTKHPNYRLALRNGSTGQQPRRQYSIIPQLFISYGWGPLGK